MFDSDKWRGALEGVLRPKVKRLYVFVSRAKGDTKPGVKSVTVDGVEYALNEYGAAREDSVITEVILDE